MSINTEVPHTTATQEELSERFGIVSQDTGYASHQRADGVSVQLDRSSDDSVVTVTVPAGGSIIADEGLVASNPDPALVTETGLFNADTWWNLPNRLLSGEDATQRRYVNKSDKPISVDLHLEGSNLYAVDLSKFPSGAIMASRSDFKASISATPDGHAKQSWFLKPWTNMLSGDDALRQKIEGSNIVLMEAGEALRLNEIAAGDTSYMDAENFVGASANNHRGLGWRLKHLFNKVLGYDDDVLYMKMSNTGDNPGVILSASPRQPEISDEADPGLLGSFLGGVLAAASSRKFYAMRPA